jgi:hypothetical protein
VKRRLIPYIILALAALGGLGATPADPADGLQLTVEPGFDGYFEQNNWVPLHITVSNDGPDLSASLKVRVEDSAGDVIFSRPVELPNGSRKSFFLYFAPRSYMSSVDVDLMLNSQRLVGVRASLRSISDADLLYGVLSDTPAALDDLGLVAPVNGSAHVAQLEVEDLPPMAEAWRVLDVLVISDVDTGRLSAEQHQALAAWVTSGGHLIVAAGPTYQRTLGGLDDLLPIRVSGTRDLSLGTLGDFTGAPLVAQEGALVASGSPVAGARVLVSSEGVPLLVSRDLGGGRVDFLAADPNLEPLRSWADMAGLWRALLAGREALPGWSDGFGGDWYSAREAIASIPGVSLPSALQLCCFLALYTVLIGPVNYLVLRRLKRREWAWFSIPGIVLFFSGCAYLTGFQIRGSRAIVHRLAVVQVWPDSDVAKIDALVGVWSPRRATYDVSVGPDFLAQPLPSDYYGGLGQPIFAATVEQGEEIVLRDVRVDVGSVQPFLLEGCGEAPHVSGDLRLDLSSVSLRVSGQVHNETGFDLEDAVILAPGGSQQLGDLPSGDTAAVGVMLAAGYATTAPAGAVSALSIPGGLSSTGYYSGGYDTTVDDIMGPSSCYANTESERRCDLLNAVINAYGYGQTSGRGSNVYLVGWSDQAPLDVSVLEAASETVDTAVYFFELPVQVERGQGRVSVPPGLMTWSPLDLGAGYNASPYELYLVSGQPPVAFRFEPIPLARLSSVDEIILHVVGYAQDTSSPPNVALWDWEAGDWEEIDVGWDDTSVSPADRFVGPDGAVHLRVMPPSTLGQSLQRVDLTLVGS